MPLCTQLNNLEKLFHITHALFNMDLSNHKIIPSGESVGLTQTTAGCKYRLIIVIKSLGNLRRVNIALIL